MIPIPSKIEGLTIMMHKLEQKLEPLGYTIGGGWEYDHGFFDYKINDEGGYQFLRLPFEAIDGQLDSNGTAVQLGRPFLLSHLFQEGLDDRVNSELLSSSINQFSEPKDPDAKVPEKYLETGERLVRELEKTLIE